MNNLSWPLLDAKFLFLALLLAIIFPQRNWASDKEGFSHADLLSLQKSVFLDNNRLHLFCEYQLSSKASINLSLFKKNKRYLIDNSCKTSLIEFMLLSGVFYNKLNNNECGLKLKNCARGVFQNRALRQKIKIYVVKNKIKVIKNLEKIKYSINILQLSQKKDKIYINALIEQKKLIKTVRVISLKILKGILN